MSSKPFLSIVIPVCDEVDNLEPLHRSLDAALGALAGDAELVFVDDGSRDGSLERLRKLATQDRRVQVIALDRNYGQSAALDAGFRRVRGEVTVTLDADLQNDPADIPRLLEELDRADVVNGVRIARSDSRLRRVCSRVANAFRNWITGESVTDVAHQLGFFETIGDHRIWIDLPRRIAAVRRADVAAFARKRLDHLHRTVGVLHPVASLRGRRGAGR